MHEVVLYDLTVTNGDALSRAGLRLRKALARAHLAQLDDGLLFFALGVEPVLSRVLRVFGLAVGHRLLLELHAQWCNPPAERRIGLRIAHRGAGLATLLLHRALVLK